MIPFSLCSGMIILVYTLWIPQKSKFWVVYMPRARGACWKYCLENEGKQSELVQLLLLLVLLLPLVLLPLVQVLLLWFLLLWLLLLLLLALPLLRPLLILYVTLSVGGVGVERRCPRAILAAPWATSPPMGWPTTWRRCTRTSWSSVRWIGRLHRKPMHIEVCCYLYCWFYL